MSVIAAFIYAELGDNLVAATTRPSESNRIGLPGGKREPGEDIRTTAIREAREEGWNPIDVDLYPFSIQQHHGDLVYWFRARSAKQLDDYKEKDRLRPVRATINEIIESGYGNDAAYMDYISYKESFELG